MNDSKAANGFTKLLARILGVFLLLLVAVLLWSTPSRAQTSGTVGILSKLTPVWQSATSTQCSKVVQDIGQGSNILFVVDTGGGGGSAVVTLQWSPSNSGQGPFYPITGALYSDIAAQIPSTHVLTLNGYFPNLQACLTYTSGTWSAWYTATSGPLSYATAGIGTFGATAPPVCDQWTTSSVPNGTSGVIGPNPVIASTDQVVVCGIAVSFNGTTSAGALNFTWGAAACASPTEAFNDLTTAGTPQNYTIPVMFRSFFGVGGIKNFLCVTNTSGATANLLVSWASLHNF
jgi:hypothetical protein